MRQTARFLLLVFAFTVPWEYSLDLGEPLGNMARIAGLLLLLAALPAVFQAGRLRTPGALQVLTLALFLWFCCSYFWTVDPGATLIRIRAYFQEMMVVWLAWEFVDTPAELRNLLRGTVAGSWVLAILTLAAFRSPEALAAGQIRFAAYGQDPNDMARFLDLAFPLAALLFECDRRWPVRLLGLGYLPIGLIAVLLTASREGFLAAVIALAGSAVLLARGHPRRLVAGAFVHLEEGACEYDCLEPLRLHSLDNGAEVIGILGDSGRDIEVEAAVIANPRRMMTEDVKLSGCNEIQKRRAAERTIVYYLSYFT